MKIGFDAKRLFNNRTGLGNYSRTLVHDLAVNFPNTHFSLYTPKINLPQETAWHQQQNNISVFKPVKKTPLWREFGLAKQLQQDKVAIYHGLSHELPWGIKKSGIKSVVTIHDLIFKIYPNTYHAFDRLIYDQKFRYACQNSDKIIAISHSTKQDIINFYHIPEEKIEVIYQACNPLYLSLQEEKAILQTKAKYNLPQNYLLYVGSVIERKGLMQIVKALSILKKGTFPPLVIIGKQGKYALQVKQYIHNQQLENYIVWLSVENDHDLQAIYQGANIFIYPSIYEGFGIPIAEALLCKTPVITSNTSSLPEAAGSHSLCVDPQNHEELASAIQTILHDSTLQEQMKENGRVYAENKFDSKKIAVQMMNCYQNLL